jgi:hypothetical protein
MHHAMAALVAGLGSAIAGLVRIVTTRWSVFVWPTPR